MVQPKVSGPPMIIKIIININETDTTTKHSLFKHLRSDDSTVTCKTSIKYIFEKFKMV